MRVIAGVARSLPLKAPTGEGTRPTTDRIKETLFNMLQGYMGGCVFLDLFAGSGGIGIEAISRGGKKSYFIENNAEAVKCIQENLKFTKFEEKAVVIKQDVISGLNNVFEKEVDVVFMDPPYGQELEKQTLMKLAGMKYITEDTLIIVESGLDTDFTYLDDIVFELVKEK
ncbi:MAG: 16S rRNA (guanine(966)-N(2))-methyltransferase RsmD, partial [Lachnospiraceae bacterium]|nr:16S rRNA (guanine(966)-N(2))-methyltransferase RsmD [Lachnospiraceae bacterium]